MRYMDLIAGATALLAAPLSTVAVSSTMQPGLWRIAVNMEMANRPRLQTERIFRRCITAADIKKDKVIPQLETPPAMSCTPKDFKRTGHTATYTLVCTGQPGKTTAEGKMTYTSPVSYYATIHTTGRFRNLLIDTTRTVHARRIDSCSD